jgi:hypothetical protein
MPYREDIKMRIEDDFDEYTRIRGSDVVMCQDAYAIFQAYEGEVKTPIGECTGWGMAKYGSRIYQILGTNFTDVLKTEVVSMLVEVGKKYPEINSVSVEVDDDEWQKGHLSALVTLDTAFGEVQNLVRYQERGCD